MPSKSAFRIISVTGAHSSVGKTTLCAILLNALPGYGAVKFTRTVVYTSVTDELETILQKDKDTAVMSGAGAAKVVWIKSPPEGLEDTMHIAMERLAGLKGAVVEGNSPADVVSPDLVIFVIGPEGHIKPSARKVSKMADIIVINTGDFSNKPSWTSSLPQQRQEMFRIDLKYRKGEIDKFLAHVQKYINQE